MSTRRQEEIRASIARLEAEIPDLAHRTTVDIFDEAIARLTAELKRGATAEGARAMGAIAK